MEKISIEELVQKEKYDDIYKLYGRDKFLEYAPNSYQKDDILDLLCDGRFYFIYEKYGAKTYQEWLFKMIEDDVLYETGNRFLAKNEVFKYRWNGIVKNLRDTCVTMAFIVTASMQIGISKNIYDNKSKIEHEKAQISEELEKIEALKKSLERDNSKLLEQEKNLINDAKIKARNILLEAKEEANSIISDMNKISEDVSDISNSKLNNLRNKLNNSIKNISLEATKNNSNTSNSISKDEAVPNTNVFVTTLGKNGVIVSNISKSNEVQVQVGSMKMSINIKYLQKLQSPAVNKSANTSHVSVSKTKNAKSEINIIGLNVDEATFVVDKFLDDCALAKLETVRIVHGKGTGKLRDGVHKFLKSNPHVKSFRMGTYGEGEMGVTVVTLK